MNTIEKAGELLVEAEYCYATEIFQLTEKDDPYLCVIKLDCDPEEGIAPPVNPLVDTLEGRRQADAIEIYLIDKYINIDSIYHRQCPDGVTIGSYKKQQRFLTWALNFMIANG